MANVSKPTTANPRVQIDTGSNSKRRQQLARANGDLEDGRQQRLLVGCHRNSGMQELGSILGATNTDSSVVWQSPERCSRGSPSQHQYIAGSEPRSRWAK